MEQNLPSSGFTPVQPQTPPVQQEPIRPAFQDTPPQETVMAPVVSTPASAPKSTSSNILVVILSILLLAASLIAGFFAWQTQKLVKQASLTNQAATQQNTKTEDEDLNLPTTEPTPVMQVTIPEGYVSFSQSKLGLSFAHPSDWSATKSSDTPFMLTLAPKSGSQSPLVPVQITEEAANQYNNNTKYTKIEDAVSYYSNTLNSVTTTSNLTVGGKPATRIQGNVKGPGPAQDRPIQYTFVQLDGMVLTIQLGDMSLLETFNKILSTFQFNSNGGVSSEFITPQL